MDHPDRRDFLKGVGAGAAAMVLPVSITIPEFQPPGRPNVILIMTDDQGYGDLGVTGNPIIRTPNIDRMADRSARLENFYVSPVCSPTRACLVTGRYNYRTRCIDTWVGRSMIDPEELTVAEILADAGYATGIFGKWHLGDCYPMRAMDQGFHESLVHRGGGIGQPSDPPGGEGRYTDPFLFHNGTLVQAEGYCTDIYFDAAMDWIENSRQYRRNFFACITTNAPHGPFHDIPLDLYDYYRGINLENDRFPQTGGHRLPEEADTDRRARIFSMITNIDQNVGRLFNRLDRLGITDNTIVIFMTDNGPNGRRFNAGMRGMKTEVYEGGIRSPFFIHWPAKLQAGHSSERVAAHIDVLPTILDGCGVAAPDDLLLDGRSLLPLLTDDTEAGDTDRGWPDRTLYIQAHRGNRPVMYHNFAARNQKWKLLHPSGFHTENMTGEPEFELYDMEFDPLERNNIAARRPDVVRNMLREYEQWFLDVSSTRSDNYAPPWIFIGTIHESPTVLTRQDWRHAKGRIWSNGYWELYAPQSGTFDIKLRFPAAEADGEAILIVDRQEVSLLFEAGTEEMTFSDIRLDKGPLSLQADLNIEGRIKGPWQVDVVRR
jgi:arylsulfatase/arylsulfatase A